CQFVHRHAADGPGHLAGEVDYVQAQYANLAGRRPRGIHFGANYAFDLRPGRSRLGLRATRNLPRPLIAQRCREGTASAGPVPYPDLQATLANRYDIGDFRIGLNTRWISKSLYAVNDQSLETREMPYVPAYWQHDLTLSWFPTMNYSVSLGIKNVTDSKV